MKTIKPNSPEAFELMRITDEQQKAARDKQKKAVIDAFVNEPIPVSDVVIKKLHALSPFDTEEVLQSHPGFVLADSVRSLRTTLDIFFQSGRDLNAILDGFDNLMKMPKINLRTASPQFESIQLSVLKEVFMFSSLAHSIVDKCYAITSRWAAPSLEANRAVFFNTNGEHEFVVNLRNALHHSRIIDPEWLVVSSREEKTTHFVFKTVDLLILCERNSAIKPFLDRCGEKVDVRAMVADYIPKVQKFYNWLLGELYKNPPDTLVDYYKCTRLKRSHDSLQGLRSTVGLLLQTKADPLDHIQNYLMPHEYDKVISYPKRSSEQIECIISIFDKERVCDQQLREMIYKFFKVEVQGS